MNKHTPGPWVYENIPGQDRDGFPSHLHRIAQQSTNMMIIRMENVGWGNDPNARLIAAAPSMYKLLSEIQGLQNDPQYHFGESVSLAIDALLAKIDNNA